MQDREDVQVDPSTTEQPDANTEQPTQTQEAPSPSETTEQTQIPQTPPSEPVETDEQKETDRVARRVTQFLAPQLKQMIEQHLQTQPTQPVQVQPQAQPVQDQWQSYLAPYSDDQIEDWAEQNPQYKPIARQEIRRRIENSVLSKVKSETVKDKVDREKQESLGYVSQSYSEAFTVVNGQKVWNQASPLVQRAFALYNSRPAFQQDGMGLAGAFDMAYGQLAKEDKLNILKDKTKTTAQQRREDKKVLSTINATGTQSPPSTNPNKAKYEKLMTDYRQNRSSETLAEIIKMKGLMPKFD